MCVASCSRCVGVTLVSLALICMVANTLLLLPGLEIHFLLDGHVTREATWAMGLWASGFLVLVGARSFVINSREKGCFAFRKQMLCQVMYSVMTVVAAGFCCLVSTTGLVKGPLCLHNTTQGPVWDVPLKPLGDGTPSYLFNRTLWYSVCEEPRGVVLWNVVLFSVLVAGSGLQTLLCVAHALNSIMGVCLGPGC